VDYGGEHHAGMGNRTHNLLIGGHVSLPPSEGRGASWFPNPNI
jgi:hypothetical protein